MGDKTKDGAVLIAIERTRQLTVEGYSEQHDDNHIKGELALAACCYAAPVKLYEREFGINRWSFIDPWPWGACLDKRLQIEKIAHIDSDIHLTDPGAYTKEERIDLLVKAGALIAAEIDRLQRQKEEVSDEV